MMILPWKTLFMFLLVFGSISAFSAPSWMTAWMGLEMNMMAFLALAMNEKSPRSSEAILKYFLIQALASAILISSAFSMSFISWSLSNLNFLIIFIMLSLLIKIGSAPFHLWVPQVIEGIQWMNLLIILIWQKLAPFILLSSCLESFMSKLMLLTSIILSATLGAIMGLSQTSTRKILAFSSINHVSWMLLALLLNISIWYSYFTLYAAMLLMIVMILKNSNINSLANISSLTNTTKKNSLIISLLSFGGLPPLMGFGPKWLVIFQGMNISSLLIFTMIMMSLITLYFYLRISFNTMLMKSSLLNPFKMNNSSTEAKIIVINLAGLMASSLLFIF